MIGIIGRLHRLQLQWIRTKKI